MRDQARTIRPVMVTVAVVLAAFLAWIALTVYGPISLPFQSVHATMTMTSRVDDHGLHVKGKTNLPDGSLIDWQPWRYPVAGQTDPPTGQVAVASGAFMFDADVTGWTGLGQVNASFSCDRGTAQAKQVVDRVGEHCEHLSGEQVDADSVGAGRQLFTQVEFVVP
jgi:hypothetical protein